MNKFYNSTHHPLSSAIFTHSTPVAVKFQMESTRRYRSRSADSDERRHRRRQKELRDRSPRGARTRDSRRDESDRHRHRSRSPRHHGLSRRHEDQDSKYRSRNDRSRERRGPDGRSSRDVSSDLVSRRNKGPLPSQAASFQANKDPNSEAVVSAEAPEKQKPNFAPSGLLAAASKSVAQADGTSIVLKYHEPPEARKPPSKDVWKLFVFKGSDIVDTIEVSLKTCWLVGREQAIVDMLAEHPSISSQHAVIQFRYVEKTNQYGDKIGRVRPYIIDLESANGTTLNKDKIPQSRYVELRDKDMIQFGYSTREYVLMHSPN